MEVNYSVKKVSPFSFRKLAQVERLLYEAGRYLAEKEGLHHWDNSHFKTAMIVCLCVLKYKVFLVYDGSNPVATIQTKESGDHFFAQKLAVRTDRFGHGTGSFCMRFVERQAKECGYRSIRHVVYDKNEKAIEFHKSQGYAVVGKTETLKYKELIMEKVLQ